MLLNKAFSQTVVFISLGFTSALSPSSYKHALPSLSASSESFLSRADFLSAAVRISGVVTVLPQVAGARGRATLETAYDRYGPRIVDGSRYYEKDIRKMVASADWKGIKAATAEPPPKTKADRKKIDGGAAERAAGAGQLSDARVLVAADLWAGAFSENSVSVKTKQMREQVEILRRVTRGISRAALEGLGEAKPEGGVLGIGAKARSRTELQKDCAQLYIEGGNAWNKYISLSNEGLPSTMSKIKLIR